MHLDSVRRTGVCLDTTAHRTSLKTSVTKFCNSKRHVPFEHAPDYTASKASEAWYNPGEGDSMADLAGVVQQLRKERDQAARVVECLDAALAALNGKSSYGRGTGSRRKISAAGRARIAVAQRARWAKVRRNGGQKRSVSSMPKKRTMSAAARRKIAAAQRARWARVKAAQR
jgi:hypothetical protein